MKKIKQQYLHPMPILYLCKGYPEESLVSRDFNTATNITLKTQMNEVATLTFDIPFTKERKVSETDCEKLVKFEDEYYIIKNIEITDDTVGTMTVQCVHESDELKGVYCYCINEIGQSPEHMFNTIMSSTLHPIDTGYKWKGTDVVNKYRHLQTEDECSVYENLVSMAEVFNGWLEFSTDENGQKWIYLRTKPIDNGKFLKKYIDLKQLGITYDSSEIFTRLLPFGSQDEVTGNEITIMEVNPTKKAYVENYSYYLAMGIPISVIEKEAKYQQFKILREDTYIDPKDLYDLAVEELEKCCVPKLTATIEMTDLSAYVDSLDEPPMVGYMMKCINPDIDFILGCQITAVERNYDKPLETQVEISNEIRYETVFQNIQHTIDDANRVISTDPNDSNGDPTGDGKPYVPMCNCKDGDHVNVTMRIGDVLSLITQTYNNLKLRVDELDKSFAEINITAKSITSTVEEYGKSISKIEQLSDSITSTVKSLDENMDNAYSEIKQTADKIGIKVSKGEMGSMIEINPESVKVAWNQNSKYCELDDDEGLILGDLDAGTYSKVGYDGRLSLMMAGEKHPYHALVYKGEVIVDCDRDDDYTRMTVSLPNMFNGIPDDEINVMVALKKVYCDGSVSPFWFGAYGWVENGAIQIDAMSYWYELDHTSDGAVIVEGGLVNGSVEVSYIIIA